jgi:peptide deformylase
MRGLVERHTHIRYTGYDAAGETIEVEARDFHARVVQHECDHLDGILYPQRMHDFSQFGFVDELLAASRLQTQPCDD